MEETDLQFEWKIYAAQFHSRSCRTVLTRGRRRGEGTEVVLSMQNGEVFMFKFLHFLIVSCILLCLVNLSRKASWFVSFWYQLTWCRSMRFRFLIKCSIDRPGFCFLS